MKNRFQTIFWMACVPFLLVPKLYSSSIHVFYVSFPDWHVRELYYVTGGQLATAWLGDDLTAATNGPHPEGALTSFFDGSVEHVFYVSASDGHVRELYYNGKWLGNDLTAATNGPPASFYSLTSFFDGSIGHVFYVSDPDSHVRELSYNGTWSGNDLTAAVNGHYANEGSLTSFFDGSGHVFYLGFGGDSGVRELSYSYPCLLWCAWSGRDLTWAASPPPSSSSLTSFFDGSIEHMFYESSDGHVRDLYHYLGNWSENDLTAATNGPIASFYFPLTSFFGGYGHVFYVSDGDSHVRELMSYCALGLCEWWGNDLTAATNGPIAGGYFPFTSFFDGSIEHVFYVSDLDWHVRQLYHYNGKWWGNDLTKATNGPPAPAWAAGLTGFFVP
jgi:hypothetical protein